MHPVQSASWLLANRRVEAWAAGVGADHVAAYVTLVKPRVVLLVLFTAVVACFVAAQGTPRPEVVLTLVTSGFLAAGGAAALNHYLDRDVDVEMERTRGRPLAAGRIRQPVLVMLGGLTMVMVGVSLATTVNLLLASLELAGAFVYVVVYSLWLKRRTPLNIVVGGLAGSLAVLGGWAAADPTVTLAPLLMAAVVFSWTPAHFWSLALARRSDYLRAGIPMLPVVAGARRTAWWVLAHVIGTSALSLWTGLAAGLGPTYLVVALLAGACFLVFGIRLVSTPDPAKALRVFKFSGVYLGVLFLGILVDVLTWAG